MSKLKGKIKSRCIEPKFRGPSGAQLQVGLGLQDSLKSKVECCHLPGELWLLLRPLPVLFPEIFAMHVWGRKTQIVKVKDQVELFARELNPPTFTTPWAGSTHTAHVPLSIIEEISWTFILNTSFSVSNWLSCILTTSHKLHPWLYTLSSVWTLNRSMHWPESPLKHVFCCSSPPTKQLAPFSFQIKKC